MYRDVASYYDLIHRARGRNARLEADLVGIEARRRSPLSSSLLDVACGTGIHLPTLAQSFELTAIDLSESMLAAASAKVPTARLVCADMRSFDLGRRFDVVLSIDSGIGYLLNQHDLVAAVTAMAEHLEPGGVMMVEGWYEPDYWVSSVSVDAGTEDGVAIARFTRSSRNGGVTELAIRYEIATAEDHRTVEELHVMRLSRPEDVAAAYNAAGLTFERLPHMLRPGRSVYVGMRRG